MFYETIRTFPQQFLKGWEIALNADSSRLANRQYRHLYYSGMGGSSFPADLVNDYITPFCNLIVVRDYALPATCDHNDLVFCASFSGNTEETIEVFKEAIEKKMNIVVLANGGKLKELAISKKAALIQIPDCIQPRCAAGYYFSSILGVLYKLGYLDSKQHELSCLTEFLNNKQNDFEKLGSKLATSLIGRVPIIYGPKHLENACRVWKIKFNENSKIHSFYNIFPELNHNEMVGYSNLILNTAVIYLNSSQTHRKVKKRMNVMKNLLSSKIPFYQINLSGNGLLQEIFESLAISDYASYFLAQKYGVDPVAVKMIEDFKLQMKNTGKD